MLVLGLMKYKKNQVATVRETSAMTVQRGKTRESKRKRKSINISAVETLYSNLVPRLVQQRGPYGEEVPTFI